MSSRSNWNAGVSAIAVTLCFLSNPVLAEQEAQRAHGAHEHGRGLLNVVVDGNRLVIEFEMPAINVVGFEHAPDTDEERRTVERTLEIFGRADALFVPSTGAACRADSSEVELEGMAQARDGSDAGAHSENREEGHSELHAEYVFYCDLPESLANLEVRLFEHLRDVDEIDVQLVTPTIQTALELHARSSVLRLVRD